MTWLSEDPTVLLIIGAAIEAILIAGLVKTGRGNLIWAMLGVLAAVGGLLLVERWWVTDRELVQDRLHATVVSLEANDVDGVLAQISPSSDMRGIIKAILPLVEFDDVDLNNVQIEINEFTSPPTATARFLALVKAKYRGQQSLYERTPFQIEVELEKVGDEWLYSRYITGPRSGGEGI
jgi:hypothetical protein